ncbi:MAG: hypothetical protein M5U15_14475 [Kiritimatiellae bacterium]|nr:hypothetical protein [Kiritimatiellia bacterium]
MDNPSTHTTKNPSGKNFDDSDIKFGQVMMFLIYSAIFLAVLFVGLRMMYKTYLASRDQAEVSAPSFVHDSRVIPPEPRLLTDEPAAWAEELARQKSNIDHYGWMDQKAEIVRIPVERAIDLIAEQGLPARGESDAK